MGGVGGKVGEYPGLLCAFGSWEDFCGVDVVSKKGLFGESDSLDLLSSWFAGYIRKVFL